MHEFCFDFKSLQNILKFCKIFRLSCGLVIIDRKTIISFPRKIPEMSTSRPHTIERFIFFFITILRLNNTFKRGTWDTGAQAKSNSVFFFLDIDSSFNKLLLQKEELEQKHLHLLQIVESEKTAKWQYTQQCEELASEIKKLRAEVSHISHVVYLCIYIMIFSTVILFRVACIFISTISDHILLCNK